jgi:zinc protease
MNRNGISRRLHAVLVPAVSVFLSLAAYADLLDLAAPLPVDPKLTVLKLPNGMNAWFVFHQRPPGKISLWLHVASGSINEEDNQRGLAHFLEHLAFDGSANFPPGTLVK